MCNTSNVRAIFQLRSPSLESGTISLRNRHFLAELVKVGGCLFVGWFLEFGGDIFHPLLTIELGRSDRKPCKEWTY